MDAAVQTRTSAADAPLTVGDRCDRCPAQAYVRATFPEGGTLLMCGHHAHEHRAALIGAGARLHDETARLTERPTYSD